MTRRDALLAAVGDDVELVTARPPGSPFATLGRRVVVTGPPPLAELAACGEAEVLAELVELLREPERAWGAAVLLSALTGLETEVVEAYAGRREAWWDAVGRDAHERWGSWLAEVEDRLEWNAKAGMFQAPQD